MTATMTKPAFNQEHLKNFRFKQLFVTDLGWDLPSQQQPYTVAVGDEDWLLDVVAHKRGVQLLHCRPDATGHLPDYATRQKIERKVTAEALHHLIVFTDAAKTTQIWQWVTRQQGKTAQYREVLFLKGEAPELLTQKLSRLHFTLDEEDELNVLIVGKRLEDAAPPEKITKAFYGDFEKQRKAFAEFINGIPATSEDQRWYTAVLIDRLMFLWFLQEKGFLDGKKDYLQTRLVTHLATPKNVTFYKSFLAPLFFRGFAEERTPTNRASIETTFGNVPYLNGGLFAEHQLEQKYRDALDVADNAFIKLFKFFSEWQWHLDERPLKGGKEINPDVLGYIFEKFVNAKENAKGAYYTKEDITDYIGKNTIIPCLLAKVRAEHPKAFDDLVWPLLQQSGDAYIYPAMLRGVDDAYPIEITNGLDTEASDLLARRKPWNKRADDAVSLPTEIWRETIARHQHTREVRAKIAAGELKDVGDLITYNLDIRQLAQDLIERCTDVALLKSFWFVLAGRLPRKSNEKFRHGLSVLDPTCGSGAFLFAALNILKPLYDAALCALQAVRSDALIAGEKSHPEKWAEVDEILKRFDAAASDRAQDYAVTKHIIVNNLYGVDIEEQATEIAKLRLFLKLVALLEPGDDIEPLPDIDFNIRHGNTLVGYATADETEKAVKGAKQVNMFSDAWEDIRIRLTTVEQQYNNFQIQQVQRGGHVSPVDKQALSDTLHELEETLNYHLSREHGVDTTKASKYEDWKTSHQPFHWYVDFYPLMAAGGFDVVIGNPPYVELSKIKDYAISGMETVVCGNLYCPMLERFTRLGAKDFRLGAIVPLSLSCTERMSKMREVLSANLDEAWISHFSGDANPSKLFEGVKLRLDIVLGVGGKDCSLHSSGYLKWFADERVALFSGITYVAIEKNLHYMGLFPKLGSSLATSIFRKLLRNEPLGKFTSENGAAIYVHRVITMFVKCFDFIPYFKNEKDGEKKSDDYKPYRFARVEDGQVAVAVLNSSIFFHYFITLGDCFHCGKEFVLQFPINLDQTQANFAREMCRIAVQFTHSLRQNAVRRRAVSDKTGAIEYDEFWPSKSKSIIDEADRLLAIHYDLTTEELDYAVNFEIKYRMGRDMKLEVVDASDD